jgi:tRNA-2-methylthio-N6-dimethylallyladenosine synthase
MPKKLYLETVGCQMNVLDSELVVGGLRRAGYSLTDSPSDADLILFNTCSVRQHAEDKIYSALGRLQGHKRAHPEKIVGVLGCMAQKDQELIRRRAPHVDIVCGPGQLTQLPELIAAVQGGDGPQMAVSLGRAAASRIEVTESFESYDPLRELFVAGVSDPGHRTPFQTFVRTQFGCDKFCTYCIVPNVRGPEQSRPPAHILAEVQQHADQGAK